MQKNKTHISEQDFQRYLENRMTEAERNAFERELQKYPFEAEALEGMQQFPASEVQNDLQSLSQKINQKSQKRNTTFWAAAATLLLLISVGVIWIQLKDKSPLQEIVETKNLQSQKEEIIPETTRKKETGKTQKKIAENAEPDKATISSQKKEQQNAKSLPPKMAKKIKTISSEEVHSEQKQLQENTLNKLVVTESSNDEAQHDTQIRIRGISTLSRPSEKDDKNRMQFTKTFEFNDSEEKVVRGKVISTSDSLPIPGVTITEKGTSNGTVSDLNGKFTLKLTQKSNSTLEASFVGMENTEFHSSGDSLIIVGLDPSQIALDEVVVIGYEPHRKMQTVGSVALAKKGKRNTKAQPEDGMNEYINYVKEKAILPEDYPSKKTVVKVKLHINSNGEITKIKNKNPTNKELFEKTRQIIMDGPGWTPEIKNGKKVESETDLRIVFKKKN